MSNLLYSTDGRLNCFCNRMTCITTHQRSCGKLMLSVISVCPHWGGGGGVPCTGPWPLPSVQGLTPPPSTHRHVRTSSLWTTDCQQVGGWHLTEIPPCCFICYLITVLPFFLFSDSSSNHVYVTAAKNRVHLIQLRSSHYCYGGKCLVHIFPRFWYRKKDEKEFKDLKEMPALPILCSCCFLLLRKIGCLIVEFASVHPAV